MRRPVLRCCYAMSGTEMGYGAGSATLDDEGRCQRRSREVGPMTGLVPYALSGTDTEIYRRHILVPSYAMSGYLLRAAISPRFSARLSYYVLAMQCAVLALAICYALLLPHAMCGTDIAHRPTAPWHGPCATARRVPSYAMSGTDLAYGSSSTWWSSCSATSLRSAPTAKLITTADRSRGSRV
eukprot:747661-Rhodomonas_salina.1